MKLDRLFAIALVATALSITSCGEDAQGAGGGGDGGSGGHGGEGGVSGEGGNGSEDAGGSSGEPYQVCTLGLCMEDTDLASGCQESYDACVGRGHYPRSCRMDADMTCGVFGETGPY